MWYNPWKTLYGKDKHDEHSGYYETPAAYVSGYENTPTEEQNRVKQLCWEYNRTAPNEQEKRRSILQTLLGTCSPMTGIEPDFHCDYGFNIHTHGLAVINYNCVILDTFPVNIDVSR